MQIHQRSLPAYKEKVRMSSSRDIASAARDASRTLSTLSAGQRIKSLEILNKLLIDERTEILTENAKDLAAAQEAGQAASLISRLDLSKPGKYDEMAKGVLDVSQLPDLVGRCTQKRKLDEGLVLRRVLCPIGVLLVIFEARPEVIVNITALALKSGNAAILKGGKESTHSFRALSALVKRALREAEIPDSSIELVESRADVSGLLEQDEFIDLVIPRGSNALVKNIKDNTKINVMGHADGICHAYYDRDADLKTAIPVILDSKTNYPAACNALESLLIHESRVQDSLPPIVTALRAADVTCRVERALLPYLDPTDTGIAEAGEDDFDTEHLSLTLSIRSVPDPDAAISWINLHGSHHTDTILTADARTATRFQRGVDSASVFVNASTRFADGMRYGFGTEVGIATGKIHARGPVGLEGLVTYKWLLDGRGQCVASYGAGVGVNQRTYLHQDLQVDRGDSY
ncbi:Gamma-glutamyl phosphate reductase [Taphrina deformans PYCC 5710]|uniref:glutamate-5-semialdehyde dehydrogenase n=1 Tax=Taphrina deformans (strain PYCC 5710 / ATCC 11124 / CBS 356.35 / IMI 108563 / JCM 9778 / NBRC 8474) TaxID=1097556 RepID=R4XJP9_TAPDE|nr:Gamma-glutamyl phosphate reductase [Taphrina deformans PYCC 5710]|eukprot:CCG83570.1 Gamma-glutamyl phosphate reductase [Taphrina deformans PYCC 5710]